MWYKEYKDYKKKDGLKKFRVKPGKGIVGCEMNDTNGWQLEFDKKKRSKGLLSVIYSLLTGKKS